MRVAGLLAANGWRWAVPAPRYLRAIAGLPLLVRSAQSLAMVCDELAVIVPPEMPVILPWMMEPSLSVTVSARADQANALRLASTIPKILEMNLDFMGRQ